MTTDTKAHAEQIAEKLTGCSRSRYGPDSEATREFDRTVALIDAGLHAALEKSEGLTAVEWMAKAVEWNKQCEQAWRERDALHAALTDKQIERDEQAEMLVGVVKVCEQHRAHAAALADRLTRLQEQVEKLQYWNSWMTDPASPRGACISKRCVSRDEVLALLALPQDGEARP